MRDGLTPGEIDAVVRDHAAREAPLQVLDAPRLRELRPDVILTQDLCRVCGVPAGDVRAAADAIGCDADVVSIDPHSLDDVLASIGEIGRRLGESARADALVDGLRARIDAVERAVAGRTPVRTLLLEWVDPPFVAGHWLPELVERAGGIALLAERGARSREISWEDAVACTPDVVVVAPCGFGLDDARVQAADVAARFAAQRPRIVVADAGGCFVRPGPRLVDGLEALAAALHPESALPPRTEVCREIGGPGR